MIALTCKHEKKTKHGKNRNGSQRWKCKSCKATVSDVHVPTGPLGNMEADPTKVFMALEMLAEGSGVRAVSRITGLDRKTITKAILLVGEKCERFHYEMVQNVKVDFCEIDEQWQYVAGHEKIRATTTLKGYVGDCWSYYGLCATSKMILSFEHGRRTKETTDAFLTKLRRSIDGRCQITSDGYPGYKHAVPMKFLSDVDYAVLIKRYKNEQIEKRYAPAAINSVERIAQFGNPDMSRCSTSYIERFNLTVRTKLKRWNRLTIGYSKNVEAHCCMFAIFACLYCFKTVHSTIKTTPAISCGVTDRKWTLQEICEKVGA